MKQRIRRAARIVQKQKDGKKLTKREEEDLVSMLAGEGRVHGFVHSLEELADELGVDRRTITNARNNFPDDAPEPRADGRYSIEEYRKWFERNGISGRRGDLELADDRALKTEKLRLDVERGRWEFEREKENYVKVADVENAMAVMVGAFNAALNAFAGRVNPKLEGLDFDDRADVLENEIEILRRTLSECDYLKAEVSDGE